MSNEATIYRRAPQVSFRQLPAQIVLFDPASDAAITLDEVGSRLWQLLEAPADVHQLSIELAREYEASIETVRADILGLLEQLVEIGFLQKEASK